MPVTMPDGAPSNAAMTNAMAAENRQRKSDQSASARLSAYIAPARLAR